MSEDYTKNIHRIGDETAFMPGGFEIAALAAGGAITATEEVLKGNIANAYALTRLVGQLLYWGKAAARQRAGPDCLIFIDILC